MNFLYKYFTCNLCKKKETPEEKRQRSKDYIIENIENKVSELYTIKEEEEEEEENIIYDIIPDYFDGKKINKKLDDKVYAKKIQRKDGSYKLSIRTGADGKLYNPMSIYGKEKSSTLLDNVCKSNDKFKTVNEKTFTWYTQFLKTKNMAHLYNAEREAE